MADNSASSYGTGVALSGKGVNYSDSIFRLRGFLDKEAKERGAQKEKKLLKPEDFKVENKDLYPMLAHQIAQVQTDYGNQWNELKNRVGEQAADYQMSLRRPEFQEKINGYQNTNSVLKKMATTEGVLFPNRDKYLAAANNAATTKDQWNALTDKTSGVITSPDYGFDMPFVKQANLDAIADKFKGMTQETLGGVQDVADPATGNKRRWQVVNTTPMPDTPQKLANEIVDDISNQLTFKDQYKDIILKKYPDVFDANKTPDEQHKALSAAALDWANGKLPVKKELKAYSDNPPKETEADEKTQNVQPETGTALTFTNPIVDKKTGEAYYKNIADESIPASKATAEDVPETVQSNITPTKAYNFNAEGLQITSDHAINLATGKVEKPSGSRAYEINQVVNIPVTKDKDGQYVVVSDKIAKQYPAAIKHKWYAVGLEKSGTEQGNEINLPRAVPLTDGIINQLKNKKVNLLGIDIGQIPKESSVSGTKKSSGTKTINFKNIKY